MAAAAVHTAGLADVQADDTGADDCLHAEPSTAVVDDVASGNGASSSSSPPQRRRSSKSGGEGEDSLRAELRSLRAEVAACREETSTLRECLAEAGILRPEAYLARLHRRGFAAALLAHPCPPFEVRLDAALLHAPEVVLSVGGFCGWKGICAARAVSRSACASTRLLWPTLKAMSTGCIYVCGGSNEEGEVLNSMECFHTSTQSWEPLPPMARLRCDATASIVGGQLYVCGGSTGEVAQNSACCEVLCCCERFDLRTRRWDHAPPLLFARMRAVAGVIGGKIYICGGCDAAEHSLDLSECLDPMGDLVAWEALPLMLESRAEPAGGVLDGKLYVCGGRGGGIWAQLSTVECFDPRKGEWQLMPPMREARSGATASTLSGRLFVCGGVGPALPGSVECFSAENCTWISCAAMHVPRYGAAAATVQNQLFIFGGSHILDHLNSAERLNESGTEWTLLPPMKERRMTPAVAASLE